MADQMHPHGENSCAEIEAMLADAISEIAALQDERAMMLRADAERQREMDTLHGEVARTRAVHAEVRAKMSNLSDEREGMDEQVRILLAELEAAERDAVPVGTLTYGTVSRAEVLTTYRQVSRVSRGPLPPAVAEAVEAAREAIRKAMEEAGQQALTDAISAAVRARNVAQGLTPTGRQPRRAA